MRKGDCPFRLRLNWGAVLHPHMKDAECCAGATRWPVHDDLHKGMTLVAHVRRRRNQSARLRLVPSGGTRKNAPNVLHFRVKCENLEAAAQFEARLEHVQVVVVVFDVEHFGHVADSVLSTAALIYPFTRSPRRRGRAAAAAPPFGIEAERVIDELERHLRHSCRCTSCLVRMMRSRVKEAPGATYGSFSLNSTNSGGALCKATRRNPLPSRRTMEPKLASQRRVAFARIVSNTGLGQQARAGDDVQHFGGGRLLLPRLLKFACLVLKLFLQIGYGRTDSAHRV
jgi:hypothetical protein